MKLLILGHRYTLNFVKKYLLKNHSDIDFQTYVIDIENDKKVEMDIRKAEKNYDALLFTGKYPYDLMLAQMIPAIPWDYVRRQENQLLTLLLKAAVTKHYDITRPCIDKPSLISFSPKTMEKLYNRIGLREGERHIHYVEGDPSDRDLISQLARAHVDCYRRGDASFCITGLSPVYEMLLKENVPAMRIRFDEEALEDALSRLRLIHSQQNKNNYVLCMAMIHMFHWRLSDQGTFMQKDTLHNKLVMIDEIINLSNQLGGALLELGGDQFCLFYYEQPFAEQNDTTVYQKLLPPILQAAQEREITLQIGIGKHTLPRVCRHHALLAMQKAQSMTGSSAFIFDIQGNIQGPIQPIRNSEHIPGPDYYTNDFVWNIAQKTGLPADMLAKIFQMRFHHQNDTFSSHDLAAALGITTRNANRIIQTLEDHQIIELIGKHTYPNGGRPLRIFRILI